MSTCSSNKPLLSVYYEPDTTKGSEESQVNQTQQSFSPHFLRGATILHFSAKEMKPCSSLMAALESQATASDLHAKRLPHTKLKEVWFSDL